MSISSFVVEIFKCKVRKSSGVGLEGFSGKASLAILFSQRYFIFFKLYLDSNATLCTVMLDCASDSNAEIP